jgi:hypothetical protein
MINEVKLQNPAGFADATGEAKIGFGRGRVAGWVIMLCGARSYVQSAKCADGGRATSPKDIELRGLRL